MSLRNKQKKSVGTIGAVALALVVPAVAASAAEVARYEFNEGSGNRALDTAPAPRGGDHNGTLQDVIYQAIPAPGTGGFSLDFNPTKVGGGQSLSQVDMRFDPATGQMNGDLARNVSALTLAAWVKPDEFRPESAEGTDPFDNVIFISSGEGPTRARASLAIGGDTLTSGFLRAGGRASDTDDFFSRVSDVKITAEANGNAPWTHIAGVFNFANDTITLYINGQQVGLQPIPDGGVNGWSGTATSNTASASMLIGMRSDGNERYDGNIDHVQIFDHALSASEVAALVPEPASLGLLGMAGVMLMGRRRRGSR